MFVCNFKINKKRFMLYFKILLIVFIISIMLLTIFFIFKDTDNQSTAKLNHIDVDSSNYTNFLKESHEDINKYLGNEVRITGYVYRLPDFLDNQFVLARTMLINSNSQAVVVGILCECNDAQNYKDYTWITVSGIVDKGEYHGEIPILRINEIKDSKVPEDEFVYEPID